MCCQCHEVVLILIVCAGLGSRTVIICHMGMPTVVTAAVALGVFVGAPVVPPRGLGLAGGPPGCIIGG